VASVREVIEWVALSIEMLAVIVIVGAVIMAATPSGMLRTRSQVERGDAFSAYKQRMGRGLLLGLELLLAADIIGTVALPPTLQSLAALGLLALIRSFLSWSLDVEIDGCWPWRARAEASLVEKSETRSRTVEALTHE
jgi:uncharacterized membrane protein